MRVEVESMRLLLLPQLLGDGQDESMRVEDESMRVEGEP
jgi:hypothetical protein